MSEQPAGPILDGLGITIDLADGDLIASAVVLAKVIGADGQVSIYIGDSEGLSWIEQMGLLAAAQNVIQQTSYEHRDED